MTQATMAPTTLTTEEIDFFWANGYLVVENAVSTDQLAALRAQFDDWTELSRQHDAAFDTDTLDGRPRFDMAAGHSATQPLLRRVNDPIAASDAYLDVVRNSRMTDGIADLIGPNVRFHHSKINSKLPGSKTEVKWHQDFAFTPHTNDDVVTALLMIDEVTPENGPLEVLPGSHTGPILSIWDGDVFTGAVAPDIEADSRARSVQAIGPAGAVCYTHTRLMHGSASNHSDAPRTLFISVYSKDDAIPVSPNPMPTPFQGEMVKGTDGGRIRLMEYEVERPELPATTSFFDQQDRAKNT